MLLLSLLSAAAAVQAYYLPGFPPQDYQIGDAVQLTVNALTSADSHSLLPYDYYYEKFHFCKPHNMEVQRESLGSILFGDRLYNSPFELPMNQNKNCVKLYAAFINQKIMEYYSMSWYVDNLPAAQVSLDEDGKSYYQIGFDLGTVMLKDNNDAEGKEDFIEIPFFHNHFDITVEYHTQDDKKFRVVGVLVTPRSVKELKADGECNYEGLAPEVLLSDKEDNEVTFSYNVYWKRSSAAWGTRWDKYLHVTEAKIHWFSIINSTVIVLLLTGMVAMILLRALHKDIKRYNKLFEEDFGDEIGWKLVHSDVFRPPKERLLLSVLVGSGCQIFLMCVISLVFSVLGFLSPSSRGALSTVSILCFIFFSGCAGYVSARLYKMMKGDRWYMNVTVTAFLVPAFVFLIFFTLNFILIGAQSSAAVPFGTMCALLALWFLISVPLSVLGAFFGFKQEAIEDPVKTAQIPREIPNQSGYSSLWVACLMGGLIPFGAIYIELYFIMNNIWFHHLYYMFGFLFVVFCILIIACSEVAILLCYSQLCAEDYKWAWRSFLVAGSSGFYMFLHSIVYLVRVLRVDNAASVVLYIGWSFVVSVLFSILTGSIGYISCLLFVRTIFGIIKID
ncbi:hypothetical protein BCR33DRAFT_757645 [Rhizoclosmatium globosum]|uniref:Transmembrane 9 superfamily member n=1 Tax=Rhizoclosmatium globosum TaxID=329046 RepID=A0A1Y2CMQ8_9FUNG|nr:hypothetical protein BCR33DRAFT_757645 [Rhizoclosmatium globosum]|eukprot:ORY48309.1 hypothetical protein BCR33DRAFT_757645 [Rhizoclosmatium globosum]